MNAKENNTDKPNYRFEPMVNTPFTRIHTDSGWFVAMGLNKLTPEFETEEQLEAYIASNVYNVTFAMMVAIINKQAEIVNELKK